MWETSELVWSSLALWGASVCRMAEPLSQPEVPPSRQCPLSPQELSRAHSAPTPNTQCTKTQKGAGTTFLWCHLRGQWDWTAALTAEAGSSHSALCTDTAGAEPRACIPHWVRAVLTQHIQVPQGCSAGPSEAAAVLLLQLGWFTSLSCQGTAKATHSQERLVSPGSILSAMSTAAAYKNCPWDPKADSPHQQADCVRNCLFSAVPHSIPQWAALTYFHHTPGDRHTLDSAAWSGGRTGQQYPSAFNSTVSSLKTLKIH